MLGRELAALLRCFIPYVCGVQFDASNSGLTDAHAQQIFMALADCPHIEKVSTAPG